MVVINFLSYIIERKLSSQAKMFQYITNPTSFFLLTSNLSRINTLDIWLLKYAPSFHFSGPL